MTQIYADEFRSLSLSASICAICG